MFCLATAPAPTAEFISEMISFAWSMVQPSTKYVNFNLRQYHDPMEEARRLGENIPRGDSRSRDQPKHLLSNESTILISSHFNLRDFLPDFSARIHRRSRNDLSQRGATATSSIPTRHSSNIRYKILTITRYANLRARKKERQEELKRRLQIWEKLGWRCPWSPPSKVNSYHQFSIGRKQGNEGEY